MHFVTKNHPLVKHLKPFIPQTGLLINILLLYVQCITYFVAEEKEKTPNLKTWLYETCMFQKKRNNDATIAYGL